MIPLEKVGGTAFIIAEFRAEGSEGEAPLYKDPYVNLFLSPETKKMAAEISRTFPPAKEMIRIRTKYFDQVLDRCLREGYNQVILLGSGFDTRSLRKGEAGVFYFELDQPSLLNWKREMLERQGLFPDVRYVSGDYVKEDFFRGLEEQGFQFHLPTFVLWEGNTVYLSRNEVLMVLEKFRERLSRFRLSFDYMSDRVISKTTGHSEMDGYVDRFERMGAPWKTGFGRIQDVVRPLELNVEELYSAAELFHIYRPNLPLESELFHHYFVCTLGKH